MPQVSQALTYFVSRQGIQAYQEEGKVLREVLQEKVYNFIMSRPSTRRELLCQETLPHEIDNTIAKSIHTATSVESCLAISSAEKSALFLVKQEGQDNPSFIHRTSHVETFDNGESSPIIAMPFITY